MREYHARTAAQPSLATGRASRRRSPTSKATSGCRVRACATIPGDRSIPESVGATGREVGRDVTGPAPHLHDGPPGGVGDDPVQQPASRIAFPAARRRTPRRRRAPQCRTPSAPARLVPVRRPQGRSSRSTAGVAAPAHLLGNRAEQVHPPRVLLTGTAFELENERLRARSAIRRRHASTSARSANPCSRSVRVRSSPGAWAPRSSSTVSIARSSAARARGARRGSGGTSASAARCRPTRSAAARAP